MSVAGDFAGWNIERFRLTLLHPEPAPTEGLWRSLRTSEPESIESKPREQVLVEQGPVGQNRLVLVSASGRLDWHLQPSPSASAHSGPMLLAGSDPTLPMLTQALKVSLQRHRQVHRLAFGATLLRQVKDLADGLKVLSGYLPRLELETHGDRDFMYRINRRRISSSAHHVQVNRVATWSLEEVVSGSIQLGPYQAPQVNTTPYLCVRLVMDINTVPSGSAISIDRMPSLLDSFMESAREVATKGDVP